MHLIGYLPEETLTELNARSTDSRSLLRAAFKWRECIDCGRAPWKEGDMYVSLAQLDCDHMRPELKLGGSGIAAGFSGLGRGQSLFAYFVEMIKTEVRCKDCHDKLRWKRNGHVPIELVDGQQSLFTGTGEAWRLTS